MQYRENSKDQDGKAEGCNNTPYPNRGGINVKTPHAFGPKLQKGQEACT